MLKTPACRLKRHLLGIHRRLIMMLVVLLGSVTVVNAGMPALLPTPWTAENPGEFGRSSQNAMADQLFQGISFFGVFFLVASVGVRWTWNNLRRDFERLPYLSYGRAFSLTFLWGLLFVVVLAMISGARELMTPGAWQKQGWTYTLSQASEGKVEIGSETARQQVLEKLRFQLWNYAATHDGQFPNVASISEETKQETYNLKPNSELIPASSWDVPGWPGLTFQYVNGLSASAAGSVLVFEPSIESDKRLVLLTNGVIGSIPVEELRRLLQKAKSETSAADTVDATPNGNAGSHQ